MSHIVTSCEILSHIVTPSDLLSHHVTHCHIKWQSVRTSRQSPMEEDNRAKQPPGSSLSVHVQHPKNLGRAMSSTSSMSSWASFSSISSTSSTSSIPSWLPYQCHHDQASSSISSWLSSICISNRYGAIIIDETFWSIVVSIGHWKQQWRIWGIFPQCGERFDHLWALALNKKSLRIPGEIGFP